MYNYENIEEKIEAFLHSLPCQSEMPMPPIKVERQNLNYANMLLDAYSSSADSEIQAISQYLYHHDTIRNEKIANALLCIAMIEMHHLHVLGELITLLGGKPFFYNSNFSFWKTDNIAYVDKNTPYVKEKGENSQRADLDIICKKLEKDIIAEQNAINGYKYLLQHIDDKYIEKIIRKIISDEQTHIKIFVDLIEKYCR